MIKKIRNIFISEKAIPFWLLLISLAAYIPLVNQIGFYWDDWPMLWFKVTKGAEGFASAFESDRPFLGFLYQLSASLLSDHPLEWQIMTVFFRWTVTLAFWWMLRQLWPERKNEVFWISMLLAVYPGFKQMPIAYVWMNAFVMLLAFVLSYGMMLKAISSHSKKGWILWTVPSVALFTFCTISTEYYTGLEICRGMILWIFLAREAGFRELSIWKKAVKVLLQWLPYLAVLAVFMFWRVVIFQFPSYQPVLMDQLAENPLKAVFSVLVRIVEDAYTATWGAWTEFFRFPNHSDFGTFSGLIFWAAVILSFLLLFLVSSLYHREEKSANNSSEKNNRRIWCLIALALGSFMIVCPGFPFWVTMLPVRLSYPYDRFLVTFMFGSSIFMVALVSFFLRTSWQRNLILSLFAAMAVGGNLLNANSYRKDWNIQKDFVSQLVTRIPALKTPTMLIADDNPMDYETDNSLTGMINIAFQPDKDWDAEMLPYSVIFFSARFGSMEAYENRTNIYQDFRGSLFGAMNDEAVVYHYSPPGCLRIIDPEQHSELNIFPDKYKTFLKISDPVGRILPAGTSSDFIFDEIFRQPIEQNWCYYFQKADLARQTEDWETIAEIGDKVLPVLKAGEASEYFVFVEAYINLDRWDDAMDLFRRVHAEDQGLDVVLCKYLHKWISNHKPEDLNIVTPLITAMNSVGCAMDRN